MNYFEDFFGGYLTWKDVILRLGMGCMGLLAVIVICFTMLLIAALHVTHGV